MPSLFGRDFSSSATRVARGASSGISVAAQLARGVAIRSRPKSQKAGPLPSPPDMKRFFMLIPEAVQLLLHAAALADRAPLFVLDMGEQVKVADLARDLIRLSGLVPDKDIEIQFTGLRPGEKMFEELIGEGELAEPSLLDKILRVRTSSRRNFDGLDEAVARLEALAVEGRSDEVLRELRDILPAFTRPRQETSPA